MPIIETTLGAIPVEQLGRVNAHEHLIIDGGYAVVKEPDFKLDSVEKGIEEVQRWKAAGGGAIVDTMPIGCGRNVDKLIAISQATGIPVIVAGGFQQRGYYLPDHWQHRYDEEEIADLMQAEFTEGADRNAYDGPIVKRSPVKAGYIKLAIDYHVIAPTTRKLIRAAGRVHRMLGVPIMVHTDRATACDEMLDLLEAAGIAPQRVMLCHVDRNPDFYIHRRWVQRGAFVEYDSPARIKYQPEKLVVELMRKLFDAGYSQHILLGGDMARRSYWKAYGGGPGLDYLLNEFTTRLKDEGFTDTELDQVWCENPARWLTIGES